MHERFARSPGLSEGGSHPARSAYNIPAWAENLRDRFEQELSERLKLMNPSHLRVLAAVQYSMTVGGKRLRPILVLESCRAAGGEPETAMPAAIAIEYVHTFSLIHDDLPVMDDDDLRRGKPTCHRVFGDAEAILAGDWLLARAFSELSDAPLLPGVHRELINILSAATQRMIEGQSADLHGQHAAPDAERVLFIHRNKTARLIEACCRIGGHCAGTENATIEWLGTYGLHLGQAFQIVDDLLDHTGTTEMLGKRTGKDATASKQTYPAVFGIESSRVKARHEIDAACAAVHPLGERASRLRELADFVLLRDH